MFAFYVSPRWAAGLGGVYLIGRFLYFFSYVKDPAKRSAGFGLSFLPIAVLLLGGIGGAIAALAESLRGPQPALPPPALGRRWRRAGARGRARGVARRPRAGSRHPGRRAVRSPCPC